MKVFFSGKKKIKEGRTNLQEHCVMFRSQLGGAR